MSADTLKLWRHLFGGQSGMLAVWSGGRTSEKKIDEESTRTRYFDYPARAEAAHSYALEESEAGREAYFCAHLLTARRRIKENAAPVVALWGDLDSAEAPNGPLKPTGVVESSPGRFHCYWRLSDEIPPERAEDLNKRLAVVADADPSGFDLSQLLRVPGTVNHKYRDRPVVKVLELDGGRSYSPRELDEALPEIEEKREALSQSTSDEPPVVLDEQALRVWRGEDTKLPDGKLDRSASLVKLGRVLYDAGGNRAVIEAALEERDRALGWNKYTGRRDAAQRYAGIVDELEKSGRNGKGRITVGVNRTQSQGAFNPTDLGNAERFVAGYGGVVRFCYSWDEWLVWAGTHWEADDAGRVHRLAKEAVRSIYGEAASAGDEDRRKALAAHATRSEAAAKIRAMLELARSEVPATPGELDASPDLFNALNGTIDLRTGKLREHRKEDLITKLAPVEYDPDATAPLWEATLERVLPSPALRAFFKKLCGYALSGDTSEHLLAMLYGTGANGKSTVLGTLLAAVGGYGMQAAPDLLIAKKGGHPTELADLFGMRVVVSTEVEDRQRFAEGLVKQLTGGDRVKARRMRQDFWEFEPTHTVFMAVNHKPTIRGTDTGIWRRIRLIPFTEAIAPADQDKQLPDKLRAELPGVLAWAVEGSLQWRREGLQAPEEVRQATAGYRSEMDVLGDFIADRCYRGARLEVAKDDLYKAYQVWCDEAGERFETKRKFGMLIAERGIEDGRNPERTRRIWKGIGLSAIRLRVRDGEDVSEEADKRGDVSETETSIDMRKNDGGSADTGHKSGKLPIDAKNMGSRERTEKQSPMCPKSPELSPEEERRVRELVRKGFSEGSARAEVLARDHPLGCECEVCL